MIAAFGEIYGAVATNDPVDLRALADVGDGFEVYVVPDLVKTLDRGR
jgi:hypothetical protein